MSDAGRYAVAPMACGRCEVAWRGLPGSACWICNTPGVVGVLRVVWPTQTPGSALRTWGQT